MILLCRTNRSQCCYLKNKVFIFKSEIVIFKSEIVIFRSEIVIFKSEIVIFKSEIVIFKCSVSIARAARDQKKSTIRGREDNFDTRNYTRATFNSVLHLNCDRKCDLSHESEP